MFAGSELWTIISGVALVIAALSFGLLGRLGEDSWYHRLNQALDKQFHSLTLRMVRLRHRLGLSTLRLTTHYLLHQLLIRLRSLLTKATKYVRGLERTNREKAKSVKQAKKDHSHLNQIAAHKKAVSLTEEQKIELKESKLVAE